MGLFGKKQPQASVAAPGAVPQGAPTERVIQMRQQGVANDQIIQTLQQEGYDSSNIFNAMSQADIKGAVGGEEQEMPTAPPGGPMPESQPMQQESEYNAPLQQEMQMQMPAPPIPEMAPAMGGIDKGAIEEVAESIIDEKWEELMKNVDKIVEWKEVTEAHLIKVDQKMKDLKERFEALHKGVLSKVSEYDKGIKGVSTDIKAMENVFKKVLPTFTSNVSELSRLTKKITSPKSKK